MISHWLDDSAWMCIFVTNHFSANYWQNHFQCTSQHKKEIPWSNNITIFRCELHICSSFKSIIWSIPIRLEGIKAVNVYRSHKINWNWHDIDNLQWRYSLCVLIIQMDWSQRQLHALVWLYALKQRAFAIAKQMKWSNRFQPKSKWTESHEIQAIIAHTHRPK